MKSNKTGCYFLLIENEADQKIKIGKLGTFLFPKGFYVYTGSALRNLDKRVERHLEKSKKLHWHIDYLLEKIDVIFTCSIISEKRIECALNKKIYTLPDAMITAPRFGSSDCKCITHLYYFNDKNCLKTIMKKSGKIEIAGESYAINGNFAI